MAVLDCRKGIHTDYGLKMCDELQEQVLVLQDLKSRFKVIETIGTLVWY